MKKFMSRVTASRDSFAVRRVVASLAERLIFPLWGRTHARRIFGPGVCAAARVALTDARVECCVPHLSRMPLRLFCHSFARIFYRNESVLNMCSWPLSQNFFWSTLHLHVWKPFGPLFVEIKSTFEYINSGIQQFYSVQVWGKLQPVEGDAATAARNVPVPRRSFQWADLCAKRVFR